MAWTERMLEIKRAAIANQLAETAGAASDEVFAKRSSPAVQCDLTDSLQSLTDEVLALRREQARLQQAIFEAAQVQRRLCAPRELTWGEFEIAGEIFPVRHLSGDFFKVLELGSTLGLALGDIAGKGLTAGEQVVVDGQLRLVNGAAVATRPSHGEAPAAAAPPAAPTLPKPSTPRG